MSRDWELALPTADIELRIEMAPPPSAFSAGAVGGDRIRLLAGVASSEPQPLAELDGRHWTFETAKAFTGRVFGVFATEGSVVVRTLSYSGSDTA